LELLGKDIPVKKQSVSYARPSKEMMKRILEENRKKWTEYKKLLDKGRKETESNGLTEEILNKLLAGNN